MIRAEKGKKIVERVSPERILTETDGPYVKVNDRAAEPKDVKLILEYLKVIWSKSFEDVEKRIYLNFKALISHISKNK